MVISSMAGIAEKREKFVRLAESRTQSALDAIRKIGNLSNRRAYEYDASDIKKITKALRDATNELERKFGTSSGDADNKFKLLKESGNWNAPSEQEEKILALQSEIKILKKKSKDPCASPSTEISAVNWSLAVLSVVPVIGWFKCVQVPKTKSAVGLGGISVSIGTPAVSKS